MPATHFNHLVHEALQVERRTLIELRNKHQINDETLRVVQRDIDLAEARFSKPNTESLQPFDRLAEKNLGVLGSRSYEYDAPKALKTELITMSFSDSTLALPRPASVREISLPRRESYHPRLMARDEVLHLLLPDRFSDGREAGRPQLDRTNPGAARPQFRFDRWAESGGGRYQGGTIDGCTLEARLLERTGSHRGLGGACLRSSGYSAIPSTAMRSRIFSMLIRDSARGRISSKLVSEAHAEGLRVILDVIFNHSGCNWNYGNGRRAPAYKPFPGFYEKGPWFDSDENPIATLGPGDADAGVWPVGVATR